MVYPAATERFDGPPSSTLDIGGDNQIPGLAQVRLDLDTEVSVRATADTALQAAINAEAATRAANDATEAATRAAADTALDARLTTEEAFTARWQRASLAAGQQLTSNSTAFQNVTGIKITGVASGFYAFRMTIGLLSTAAADAKFQFTVPAGAVLAFSTSQYLDAVGVPTLSTGGVPAATPVIVGGSGANIWIEVSGTVIFGGTAGDCQLQAAQNTATVENVDFVVQGTNITGFKVN